MNAHSAWKKIVVPGRSTCLVENAAGVELLCIAGAAWITQYGDDRDLVLHAGQRAVLSLPTAIVMSSRSGAELLSRPHDHAARRGRGWLRRLLGVFDPRWSGAAARGLNHRIAHAGV
ncbi:MAG: DUF2917 domain-containing protein [Rhodocyclaceae bacterium]|nr:DUF2917 domain-containing protein [Rhodocyclaceae bacterium]